MTEATYDIPDEIQVEADGPIRIVRLNRPDNLIAKLFPELSDDLVVRAVVLTGNGRAFSAGGDMQYLDELIRDEDLRSESLTDGRQIVAGMVLRRSRMSPSFVWLATE